MTSRCQDRITSSPSSIIITYLMPVISTRQNPSYWQMCCPLASVENVLAAEWLWIKPQSLQPLLPRNAFTFVAWQVNVSWLPSEIFYFFSTEFDERHLANWQWYPVRCNLYSAFGIWAWNERAGYRLKGKKQPQPKGRANQHGNSHSRRQACNSANENTIKGTCKNAQFFQLKFQFSNNQRNLLWILKNSLWRCSSWEGFSILSSI